MTKQRNRALLAVVLLAALLTGCTGDQWQKAAQASNDLITTVQNVQQTEISFYEAQSPVVRITSAEHVAAQQVFKRVAAADKHLNDAILHGSSGTESAAAYQAALDATDAALQDGTISFQDKTVQASVLAGLTASRAILASIAAIAKK